MAILDFPNNPTDGQVFAAPNGITYRWKADAHVWLVWGTGSNAAIIGSLPPADPFPGQLWWSDVLGQLFIWFSTQWVPAASIITQAAAPAMRTAPDGFEIYNTDDIGSLRGASWSRMFREPGRPTIAVNRGDTFVFDFILGRMRCQRPGLYQVSLQGVVSTDIASQSGIAILHYGDAPGAHFYSLGDGLSHAGALSVQIDIASGDYLEGAWMTAAPKAWATLYAKAGKQFGLEEGFVQSMSVYRLGGG